MNIKKVCLPICAVAIALILGISIWSVTNQKVFGSDITANNADNLESFAALQVEKSDLQDKLGPNSIYPEFRINVEEEKLLDKSQAEAISETENELLEKEALYWYATNHGIQLSDEETQQRIEAAITDAKTAENYDEVAEACKAAGTTFEATMRENKETYKKEYIINDLYNAKLATFNEGEKQLSEEKLSAWEAYWDDFVKTTVSEYEKTKNFAILDKAISKNKVLIQKDITDIDRVKASDIFVFNKLNY